MAKSNLLTLSIEDIRKMPPPEQISTLQKLVSYHNQKYFIENSAVISDPEFDVLSEALRKLDPNNPVLLEIVGEIGEIRHPAPMLSLEKCFTYEEVRKWIKTTGDSEYLIEPKYDGMAARYQSGTLSTRGNGFYGEDISERLKYLNIIGNLPKDDSNAYGEIVIPNTYFNSQLAKTYKNPRNAVVGIVKAKLIKPEGVKALMDGGVHFVLHDQAKHEIVSTDDLMDEECWESTLETMFQSDYPLDGVVLKARNPELKAKLGSTIHHNKWEIAYKTPAERKWSVVNEIKDQVGRTGRVTSVAVISPVDLSGATVTNVTLHNFEFVKKSRIGVGAKVEVCRSGEVIPFITQVIPSESPRLPRKTCPVCKTHLIEEGKYLTCPNLQCPARLSQSIEYFFKVLGVEELGLKTIERFINEFKIDSIIDFYSLSEEKIANLEGFGDKSAKKIIKNIQNTLDSTVTPPQLLQALGIKEIGPAASRWIINQYGFDNLISLKTEDLENIKGIGTTKASHFVTDLKQKWPIIVSLKRMGLKFKIDTKTDKLDGKKFAITGKKAKYSRDELIEMINKNGGEYKSSITNDLSYLIAGEDGGSKEQKAREIGAKIISEEDFLKMID